MKGLITAASVVVILIVSTIALVVINANDTATASQTDTTQLQTETTVPETDVPMPDFMEERLQDLVERGFITQEQLDEMEGRFRGHVRRNGELPDDLDT
jgi:competence protein ComGC